jgi:AcrR family transcriptional regulator
MSDLTPTIASRERPMRADAARNRAKLTAAGRDAFAQDGASASLEDIARRAGVGIGTLYRHFPARVDLLEAIYVDEVEALCARADELAELPPWDALVNWLHRFVGYVATKQALVEALLAHLSQDADVFRSCRAAVYEAGEPLVERAQRAGAVRTDTDFNEVIQLVVGIAKISATPREVERILDVALDGLRYQPSSA